MWEPKDTGCCRVNAASLSRPSLIVHVLPVQAAEHVWLPGGADCLDAGAADGPRRVLGIVPRAGRLRCRSSLSRPLRTSALTVAVDPVGEAV